MRPMTAQPGALAACAVLALVLAGGVTFIAFHPKPAPPAPVTKAPEWRCADQTKGGPICVRPLPAAAKRAS